MYLYIQNAYLYIQNAAAAAAAALMCVVVLLLLLHQLLLFVIVCRMAQIVAGSLNLIASTVFFLFILKQDLSLMYVRTRWQCCLSLRPRFALYYILGN